ncbi:MAG: insulinase family protein [Desulfobacterota bacterium]|nr:insulinase family protein [Thermodesulfobacteriota bacterium]
MRNVHHFACVHKQEIPELCIAATLYQHEVTGAELLSIRSHDPNKVFCITFTTPTYDATGVSHILEHAVLCGSRKYPVKEPFVELLKGSLHTFLNACTYPDRTCYPVASQNIRDFYNLIDVYCDAVFYPLLKPVVFRQEGWHYVPSEDTVAYQGIVFNEMKGAYSSPESLLAQACQASLFPDTFYRFDAGGDPEHIPSLTYEQFVNFHRTYYHPSNCKIFFYGDDDEHERLRFMEGWLQGFERRDIAVAIPRQPLLNRPQKVVRPFAAGAVHETTPKGMAAINWLLPLAKNPDTALAWSVLEHMLLGMPASPLRKALLESGIGEGLTGVGLDLDLAQMYFSTGLKGVPVERIDEVEPLVIETLAEIVRTGIDPRTRAASCNTIEFRLRENNSGRYPRGLILLLRGLTTWIYGGNPCDMIAFAAPLERLYRSIDTTPRLFEQMIEETLLANRHRTTVQLLPDPAHASNQERREREYLKTLWTQLAPAERDAISATAREVSQWQNMPDPPEALAALPRLTSADLDRTNTVIPCACQEYKGVRILLHDIFTSGICYIDIGLDLHLLPADQLSCVPVLGRALLETGTAREDFVSLSQHIGETSGGIKTCTFTSAVNGQQQGTAWLFLRAKAMERQVPEVLEILTDILLSARLDHRERIRLILCEEKAAREQLLIPQGHQVIGSRLRARFHEADWADEKMNGCSYLLFLRSHEQREPIICDMLETMREALITRRGMVANVTTDAASWRRIEQHIYAFIEQMPDKDTVPLVWSVQDDLPDALCVPSRVNFVGKAMNLYELGYSYHGSIQVMTHLVRTNWLWDKIRVQGGAYGAFCTFDRMSGTLLLVSYRDPHLLETLAVFDRTADFLRTTALDTKQIERSIIGTIGDIDQPLLPDAQGLLSLQRFLNGNTDELRQKMRDEILATSPDDLRSLATVLDKLRDRGSIAVLGSPEKLQEAKRALNTTLRECTLL